MGKGSARPIPGTIIDNTSGGDTEPCTNIAGESHYYNCGSTGRHLAHDCQEFDVEQQAQLHMNLGAQNEEEDKKADNPSLLLQVALLQGSKNKGLLDESRAYLDSCSTINAFKNSKYLSEIQKSDNPSGYILI